MPVVRNKSTEFGKNFWTHVQSIAEQVRSLEAQKSGAAKQNPSSQTSNQQEQGAQKTGPESR